MHALTTMGHDMFTLGVPLLEKIIRPILVYIALIVMLRLFGKRELAQLNNFDLVVLLSLSNTVQNAIIGEDNSLAGGLIGAFALLLTNYLVVRFLFRHPKIDEVVEGSETELIRNGKIVEKNMSDELITKAELEAVARRQGFDGLSDLESCVLEPGGAFVMRRRTPTAEELRQQELVGLIDSLVSEVQSLRTQLAARG